MWLYDRIYPIEFEIKDSIDTTRSESYFDIHIEIEIDGGLSAKLYDKSDDLNFPIVNFPFICSNIPTTPVYGVYISQLIRYSRACGSYQDFLDRGLLLTRKLLNHWLSGSHHCESFTVVATNWVTVTEYLSKMTTDSSVCSNHNPVLIHKVFPGLQ